VKLKEILDPGSCSTSLEARNRDDAVFLMAGLLAANPAAGGVPPDEIVRGLWRGRNWDRPAWATALQYRTAGSIQ